MSLLEVRTDGTQVCWSAGPSDVGNYAPDLVCYRTGESSPVRIFANPKRDSNLAVIAVAGSTYAVAEQNERAYGVGGWRLWLIESGRPTPVEVDRSDAVGGMVTPPPTIALSDRWLVWGTFHQAKDGPHSLLQAIEVATHRKRTMASGVFDEVQYWFPAIDGDRLAFGTMEQSSAAEDWHVYLASMVGPWQPVMVDRGQAAEPALSGDLLIWKRGGQGIFDWGTLVRHSITTGEDVVIDATPQPALNYPSVGTRFVAAWGLDDTKFYVYDVVRGQMAQVAELDPRSKTGFVRPTVSGSLIAVIRGTPRPSANTDLLQLLWAELPD